MAKLTREKWIEKAKQIHSNKYDYSKVEYNNCRDFVVIICPIHGEFTQMACRHLIGNGCPKCAKDKRAKTCSKKKTTDEFIKECEKKYGNKFDYTNVEYINSHTKVHLINNETKEDVYMTPTTILSRNIVGKNKVDTEKFITKAKKIHGNKYDYSDTIYVDSKTKIKFICPKHGVVEQLPENHLKYGCRFCSREQSAIKRTKTLEQFINDAKKIHGDRYDYSKVEYKGNKTKVRIICKKHGEFLQSPIKHINGHGCPKCNNSTLETDIRLFLEKNNIKYENEYSPIFLKNGKGQQRIDFFLSEYNIGIECQGIQHFIPSSYQPLKQVEINKERDIKKAELCKKNGINLIYYTTKSNFEYINECEIYTINNTYYNINETLIRLKNALS